MKLGGDNLPERGGQARPDSGLRRPERLPLHVRGRAGRAAGAKAATGQAPTETEREGGQEGRQREGQAGAAHFRSRRNQEGGSVRIRGLPFRTSAKISDF